MGIRSDAARALYKMVSVTRVPALKDNFDAAKPLAGTPGIDHFTAGHLDFDAKVALDSGNRIDNNSFSHMISSLYNLKNDCFSYSIPV